MDLAPEFYTRLQEAVRLHAPSMSMELLERAYYFAARMHHGCFRKDKVSLYIIHPLATAAIVAEMGLDDPDSIVAALLHDTLEDTTCTHEGLRRQFGATVADLVEGVTKLTRVNYSNHEERADGEPPQDVHGHEPRTSASSLSRLPTGCTTCAPCSSRARTSSAAKSLETMEIYAPLAHRLGMQRVKWELEDTSLQLSRPRGLSRRSPTCSGAKQASSESFMARIQQQLEERMAQAGIHCTVYGRVKHIYSIYRKMYNQNKQLRRGLRPLCLPDYHRQHRRLLHRPGARARPL